MRDAAEQVVFITGGASGMGLQAALTLAARGAHVAIFSRGEAATQQAAAQLSGARRSGTQRIGAYAADVVQRASLLAIFAQAARDIGVPDVVINMAGVGGSAALCDMPFEQFDQQIKINLYGSRHVAEAAIALMAPRRRGRIVLVGSLGGFIPVYGYTAYGASKFGVVGLAQCLRPELKPLGIALSCFCPGEVGTAALAEERLGSPPATRAFKALGGTISPEQAVGALLDGIAGQRFLIVPGWRSRLLYWAYRLTPLAVWNAISDLLIARALRHPAP